jgi:hypothetical protein
VSGKIVSTGMLVVQDTGKREERIPLTGIQYNKSWRLQRRIVQRMIVSFCKSESTHKHNLYPKGFFLPKYYGEDSDCLCAVVGSRKMTFVLS